MRTRPSIVNLNIEQYIASGILEQYAMGMTTEAESLEVEQNVGQYPEIAAELQAIQLALEQLAASNARSPREGIEEELMAQLDNPKPQVIAPKKDFPYWTLLLAGLILSLFILTSQVFRKQQLEQELASTQATLAQLQKDCDTLRDTSASLIQYANIVGHPDNQTVVMSGQEIAPTALAAVYWNPKQQNSFLEVKNLPPPPNGKQYQLWAIVEGKPVDMGVFDVDQTAGKLQRVDFIEQPQAFAVTLEDVGGSPSPTLDQMYVLGNKS